MSSFNPMETPIDSILIGDPPLESPGICRVIGAFDARKWEKIMGPGWSGGFSRFMGMELCDYGLEFDLASDEDWEAWWPFKALLCTLPTGRTPPGAEKTGAFNALKVIHPWLIDARVTSSVLVKLYQPVKQEQGHFTIKADMLAFRMPKMQLAKVEGSAPPEKLDPYDQKIKALSDKIAARNAAAPNTG
jgi:hypothetical protein